MLVMFSLRIAPTKKSSEDNMLIRQIQKKITIPFSLQITTASVEGDLHRRGNRHFAYVVE